MKFINKFFVLLILVSFAACNLQSEKQSNENTSPGEDLEKQSDEFSKSMDNLDVAMDVAKQLNERIQLVEQRFQDGEISREKADELIKDINKRYGENLESVSVTDLDYIFPKWLKDIGIEEPQGLTYDENNSFQTREDNIHEGYNSVLFVYHGPYHKAMKEAERIAAKAGIPLSENYRKALELSDKLGKEFKGLKGVTYMNYKLGSKEYPERYKKSINVDEKGKFTLTVVDIKTKTEREQSGSLPKGF